ncbi:hypothetical protein JW926_17780 [Candidatus Sumerlaeota bacterium]|nr:hypothetical protein [Candidatus Sumerlaeota bacterium]
MLKRAHYNTFITVFCILIIPYTIISYNHIGEDCFISFRYVDHFVEGKGLVFNEGERVEGYSNLLWVMILALFRWMGVSSVAISKALGVLSTMLLLWVASYYSLKKNQRKIDWIYLATPLMVFFNPMIHYHTGRGLETTFYAFLFIWAMFSFKRRNYLNSSLAFSAIALTRPEGFAYFWLLVPILFLDLKNSRTEKFPYPVPNIRVRFFLPYICVMIVFFTWRFLYYGSLLPNTVYAKTTTSNFFDNPSLHMLLQFIISWSYIPLFAVLAIFTYHKEEWELQRSLLIPMVVGGGILLFTLSVGQVQASPFRHYVPMIPILIILFQEFLRAMKKRVEDNLPLIIGLFVIFQGMNFYTSNNLDSPKTRLHSRTIQFIASWNFPARVKWFFEPPIVINAEAGKWCTQNLPEDALIGADQIGQFGYYAKQRILDLLGLTDKEFGWKRYSVELLLSRKPAPDYLVLIGRLGDKKPFLTAIAQSFEKPEFKEKYVLRWILQPNNAINQTEFCIYALRERLKEYPEEPEIIPLGLDTETWQSKMRL